MPLFFGKTLKIYKDSYSGHPREIWILVILTFINRTGTMVLPFLTVYLTTVLNFSLKDAGLLAGAFGIGSFAGAYAGGKLSDHLGPKIVMIGSLLMSGIMFILIQYGQTFNVLFVSFVIAAFFGEGYRPAAMSYVAEYVPKEKRGRTMAFLRLAVNLGMSAGPLVGGFLAATMGYSWLFWIDGLTCIFAAFYFITKSGGISIVSSAIKESKVVQDKSNSIPPYKNGNFLLFLFASFIMGIAFVQWFNSVPVFLKSEWGFDERYIGMYMAINTILIVLFEMPLINELEKLNKIKISVLISLVLSSIAFLPFLFPGSIYLCIIAILFFSMGEILFFPFNNSITLNMSPESRMGEYMSWYWMAWSLTSIVGPVIGLYVAEEYGFSSLWVLMAGLVMLSFILNILNAKRIIH